MTRFEQPRLRACIFVLWTICLLGGLLCFKKFMAELTTGVEPPSGSDAAIAKEKVGEYFRPPAVMLTGLVRSRDGSPIINPEASIFVDPASIFEDPAQLETSLTPAARNLSHALRNLSHELHGECSASFLSFWDVGQLASASPNEQLLVGLIKKDSLFSSNSTSTLMVTTISACYGQMVTADCVKNEEHCKPVNTYNDRFKDFRDAYNAADGPLELLVTSFPDIETSVMGGIDKTVDVSTATLPVALLVLAAMLANARFLICTLLNIACCITATILIMYPVSLSMDVSSEAPSLMIAVALALSIDYSLFLLSRYGEEVNAGQPPERAVEIMLATSGHTVLVSGTTLGLCFLGMLIIPVTTISSMGLAAAVTVFFAIALALSLTPALLLAFPHFFVADRFFGCSSDGCCGRSVSNSRDLMSSTLNTSLTGSNQGDSLPLPSDDARRVGAAAVTINSSGEDESSMHLAQTFGEGFFGKAATKPHGCWARMGSCSQRYAILVLLVAAAAVVPFVYILPSFDYVEGVLPLMPRSGDATDAFVTLQQEFGVGTVFPNTMLIVPHKDTWLNNTKWTAAACDALVRIAQDVTATLKADGVEYEMHTTAFDGFIMQHGICLSTAIGWLAANNGTALVSTFEKLYVNSPRDTATIVRVSTKLNPFTREGQQWYKAMRKAMPRAERTVGGKMYLSGIGAEQMDGAAKTFGSFPLMITVTLLIVCAVIGVAFRSIVVPLRAVLCIVWMLCVVFGSAVFVYQSGALEFLGLDAFKRQGNALFWMSPCIAFSIVVGLGLDYDVFFTESVVEAYDKGVPAKEAIVRALAHTGNIICAAGVIMAIAFGALLLGSPALNQISFLLVLGVLVDCFVTTKFIIPACCALMSTELNFWPRKPAPPP